jgi:hypothetical protein
MKVTTHDDIREMNDTDLFKSWLSLGFFVECGK